MFIVAL